MRSRTIPRAQPPADVVTALFGIDVGTTATKGLAIDPDGTVRARAADFVAHVIDANRGEGFSARADREVLTLIAWGELTVAEAARVLGCPARVFSVRLHRARQRLERLLAQPAGGSRTVSTLPVPS